MLLAVRYWVVPSDFNETPSSSGTSPSGDGNQEREKVVRSDVKKDSALKSCSEAAQLKPVAYVSSTLRKVPPLTPRPKIVRDWGYLARKADCASQMMSEWCPNDVQMISKWCLNDVQMMSTWCPNDVQMICKWYPSDAYIMPTWYPHDAQMLPKWCPNGAQMISKRCPNDIQMMAK